MPIKSIFHLVLCAAFTTSAAAHAEEDQTEAHWLTQSYTMNFSGNLTSKQERAKDYMVETIFTDIKTANGNVAFTCISDVMAVAIASEPTDFASFIQGNRSASGWRTRKVPMTINGKQQRLNDWTYLPSLKILMPRKKSDRAKIYNAAIRQEKVVLNLDFKSPLTLILPKPNAEFAEFGGPCGLGNRRHMDAPTPAATSKSSLTTSKTASKF